MAFAVEEAILDAVARDIVTLDGAAYASLKVTLECQDADCTVDVRGGADVFSFLAMEDRAFTPVLRGAVWGVPRALGRQAERVAQDDPDALAEIRRYSTLIEYRWSPEAPDVVEIRYGGLVVAADAASPVAVTGSEEYLIVMVDVRAERVLRVKEHRPGIS